jgi:heme oxygenase
MLGGRFIVKRLRAVLGPAASFRFYGDGNIRYESAWASFCSDLEKEKDVRNVQAICDTAAGIFNAYAAWLSEPLLRDGSQ